MNSPFHASLVYLKAAMPHIQAHEAGRGQCVIPVAHPALEASLTHTSPLSIQVGVVLWLSSGSSGVGLLGFWVFVFVFFYLTSCREALSTESYTHLVLQAGSLAIAFRG